MKLIIRASVFCFLTMLAACGSEYQSSDLAVSDQGVFVKRGTTDEIDGTVIIAKANGDRLVADFQDGYPHGDIEVENVNGDTILEASFKPKISRDHGRGFQMTFINEVLEKGASELAAKDYLDLFEEFSNYHGDFFNIDRENRKTEGYYNNGQKLGQWRSFCENEQLESDVTYANFGDSQDEPTKTIKIDKEFKSTCDGQVLLSAMRDKQGRLDGKYIENSLPWGSTDKKAKPKYQRNYSNGELDGEQKEYNRNGVLTLHSNYRSGVKQGIEKVYRSQQDYKTNETQHWLSEAKSYVSGQLEGGYERYDNLSRVVESGRYQANQKVGLWSTTDYSRNSLKVTDYDSNNFILEKSSAFQDACALPRSGWGSTKLNWNKSSEKNLSDCEYYVSQSVVDINKKIDLNRSNEFKGSNNWTYAAIVAAPKFYEYMKTHGLNTRVSDSEGNTRLHKCLMQISEQYDNRVKCSAEEAISYIKEVDINAVSNAGTALHVIAQPLGYGSRTKTRQNIQLEVAGALIESGADIDKLNLSKASPLMLSLKSAKYDLAEVLLDAGATPLGADSNQRTALAYLFLDHRLRWKKKAVESQATRVLAKMIAAGLDADAPVIGNDTVRDLAEKNNTLFHLQTLKDAKAMAGEFRDSHARKVTQATTASDSTETTTMAKGEIHSKSLDADEASIWHKKGLDDKQVGTAVTHDPLPENTSSESNINDNDLQTPRTAQLSSEELASSSDNDKAQALLGQQAGFLIEQAYDHIANFRLQTPKTNSALGSLEQLKRIDPTNAEVIKIERAIGQKYLDLAISKIQQARKSDAQKHVNSAKKFIKDDSVLNDYQTKIDNIKVVAQTNTITKSKSPQKKSVELSKTKITCDADIKAVGVPLLGRTMTVRQSLPFSERHILSKSEEEIRQNYINLRPVESGLYYEQARKSRGTPLKFNLSVRPDGNNSMLTIVAKIPAGLSITKANARKAFCELISSF